MEHDEEKDFIRSFTNFKYMPLYSLLCKQIEKENIRLTLTEKFLVFRVFIKHIMNIALQSISQLRGKLFLIIFQ